MINRKVYKWKINTVCIKGIKMNNPTNKEPVAQLEFPLNRIFPTSLKDYALNHEDRSYDLKGIHYMNFGFADAARKALEVFAEQVPQGAEAVVDFRNMSCGGSQDYFISLHGTALVPHIDKLVRF